MKLNELKSVLRTNPSLNVRFVLPDGDQVPAHFHITEVGHLTKRFIDCGGTLHEAKHTCLLQTWHSDKDLHHRLSAGTFAKILDLGQQVLPDENVDVEVEYDCCVVAQYPVDSAAVVDDHLELHLGEKHTDCLAKEKCGIDDCEAAACC